LHKTLLAPSSAFFYNHFMKSVALCGSRRFKKEIRNFADKLEKAGVVVYQPLLNTDVKIRKLPEHFQYYSFLGLTHHQFEAIRKADVVFIYNKGGYMGNSTTLELGFAIALSKPIYALEKDADEPCRNILIDKVIKTPKHLINQLK